MKRRRDRVKGKARRLIDEDEEEDGELNQACLHHHVVLLSSLTSCLFVKLSTQAQFGASGNCVVCHCPVSFNP